MLFFFLWFLFLLLFHTVDHMGYVYFIQTTLSKRQGFGHWREVLYMSEVSLYGFPHWRVLLMNAANEPCVLLGKSSLKAVSLCLLNKCMSGCSPAWVAVEVLDWVGMVEHSEGKVLIVWLIDLKWHSNEFLAEGGGSGQSDILSGFVWLSGWTLPVNTLVYGMGQSLGVDISLSQWVEKGSLLCGECAWRAW